MKWPVIGAIIVISVLLASYGWTLIPPQDLRGSKVGDRPYGFVLRSCDGPTYSLDDDLGQGPILLEFAKHDCGGCNYMCTVLNDLYVNYSSRVVFVTLISDDEATMQDVRDFKYDHNSEWTFLYDRDGKIYDKYGNEEFPTFYLIDEDGTIQWTSKTPDPFDSPSITTYSQMEHNLTKIL
jgi:peroxiredoxin